MLYFDSNYILKCYLPEPNSQRVRALAAKPMQKSCSSIGRTEVLAALHRKLREGSLTRQQFNAVWTHFLEDESTGVWTWLPFDHGIQREVERRFLKIGAKCFLRSGDAIHLATASVHGFPEIHSHDKHVLLAAPEFGLRGVDVL